MTEPPSADERASLGRKARARAKRSSHAPWEPPADEAHLSSFGVFGAPDRGV